MVPFFRRRRVESMLYASRQDRSPSWISAALAVAVVGVLGAAVPSPVGAQSSSKILVPGEAERERALKSEAAQRLTQRDAPGRREERLRSRSALRGASRAELLQAGRLHFADVFSGRLFDGRHPDPQMTVTGYRGESGALVKDAEGRKLLLKSTLPLQARAANGELAPVDLSLRESIETFTTANSNADVQIFKDPARGIRFLDEGFSVIATPATSAAQPDGVQSDGRVFFDDVDGSGSDVSFLAVPKPTGVEVGWLLGTDDAPQTYTLKLDLPASARVRRTQTDDPIPGDPPRTFEIVDHNGASLAYITPPMTVDSDGVNVESSMRITDHDRLVVAVEHRGKDLRYPLFVDPEVIASSGVQVADWKGWSTYQTPATPTRVASDYNHNYYGWALHHPAYFPTGAYMSMPTNTFFDIGTGRGFEYRALPGTYVSQATFGSMAHSAIWPSGTHNSWWQGILSPARNAWQHLWVGYHSAWGITHHFGCCASTSPSASDQNYANLGIGASAPNWNGYLWSGSNSAALTLEWANVYIADPNPPQLTSARPADQDWSSTASRNRSVSGWDLGTGLVDFRLTGPAIDKTAYSTATRCHSYGTTFEHSCPIGQIITKNIEYAPAEGSNTYTLTATDAAGNASNTHTWTEKIDTTPPELQLGGTLATAFSDPRFRGLYDAEHNLSVTAHDQDDSRAESGAVSVRAELQRPDGSVVTSESKAEPCTAGRDCSLSLPQPLVVRTDEVPDGPYKVVVNAQDAAGNATMRSQEVIIDRRGDIYEADVVDGDPAAAATDRLSREWAQLNSAMARSQDDDEILTRQSVPCDPDDPGGRLCDEVRTRVLAAGNGTPSDDDSFETYVGDGTNDPNLESVATISRPASRIDSGDLKGSGPMRDLLASWQVPPPGASSQYDYYERSRQITIPADQTGTGQPQDVTVVHGLWLDDETKLPIKAHTGPLDADGTDETLYWSYRPERFERSELTADHFGVPRPSQPSHQKNVTMTGTNPVGLLIDRETGMPFRAYTLGLVTELGSLIMCLDTNWIVEQDIAQADDAFGIASPNPPPLSESRTDASSHYSGGLADVASCVVGSRPMDDPVLSITSAYAQSSAAAAWREAHGVGETGADAPTQQAVTIEGQQATAYILTTDQGLAIYVEVGGTAITISARLPLAVATTLLNTLELM